MPIDPKKKLSDEELEAVLLHKFIIRGAWQEYHIYESDVPKGFPPHVRNDIMKAAKELKIPVYVTEQYPKGLGKTIPELNVELSGATIFEKMTFSSAQVSALIDDLKKKNISNVIVVGMEAHVCVSQSALDLLEFGFKVFVLADACCSQRILDYECALERLRSEEIIITTTEAAIFEMLYSADTPEFRTLRNIFKE